MKKPTTLIFKFLIIALLFASCTNSEHMRKNQTEQKSFDYAIVLHGGAGNISREYIDSLEEIEYTNKLNEALSIGEEILKNGGTAKEAVQKTINFLEDCPLFNAGKGAVFTHDGTNELDASFMDGKTLNAGAVAGVRDIKNPINAAIAVMENSPHVLLSREGASEFAREQGLEMVDSTYFFTQNRWDGLQRALEREKIDKHGTVGCVALDKEGNLCAGTSTGGMTNKRYGRIGDSPIIGAGTYANNNTCGISSTGHGEFFIRYAVAYDISALIEYKDFSIEEAANEVIMNKLKSVNGNGGIVGLDKYGNPAMVFNTSGMFRAYTNSNGERIIAMFE